MFAVYIARYSNLELISPWSLVRIKSLPLLFDYTLTPRSSARTFSPHRASPRPDVAVYVRRYPYALVPEYPPHHLQLDPVPQHLGGVEVPQLVRQGGGGETYQSLAHQLIGNGTGSPGAKPRR